MRAVRVHQFGGPEVLKIEDNVPIPECKPNEVLIRIHKIGVNIVDTYIRTGTFAYKPQLPYTPGKDSAGIVESVGSGVTKFKKGDRVFTSRIVQGAYAEFLAVPDVCCWRLPDRTTFAQGAAIGVPYFTAYRAMFFRAKCKPSQWILVHGASGAVGLPAVQLARAAGMTVIGTAGTAEGMKQVLQNGAHFVFNHREEGYLNKIKEATNNEGVDVILEMVCNVNLGNDLTLLKRDGVVVTLGSNGKVEINPSDIMFRESNVIGSALMASSDSEWAQMGAAISTGLENGTLTPPYNKEYPLESIVQIHKDITGGATGKFIIDMTKHHL